ncbi:MAG: XdhC/CoxI family protein [Tissierellia bacterium]|nr:XdhC/CoxI family protein [Tissierellia bacterium]
MQAKILQKIYEKVDQGQKAALVLLTENKGSTPGRDGSVMAVFQDGTSLGTIGGGAIEYDIIKRAKEAMENGDDFEFDYNLTEKGELKMACGGDSKGFVKLFFPNKNLIIFGAGHVSQKLSRIAVKTGFNVIVTDDREEYQREKDFQGIQKYITATPKDAVEQIQFHKDNTYIVVCTRGHNGDEEALKALLPKDYKYLGMIGSRRKVGAVIKKLREEGFTKEQIGTVHMPIGLNIDDGSVEEIAISILAEILMIKNNGSGQKNKAM